MLGQATSISRQPRNPLRQGKMRADGERMGYRRHNRAVRSVIRRLGVRTIAELLDEYLNSKLRTYGAGEGGQLPERWLNSGCPTLRASFATIR
jgi:hypothetical protein